MDEKAFLCQAKQIGASGRISDAVLLPMSAD